MIRFAIPLVLSNLLQQLYNTVDLMIVGQFSGKHSMAAIGATVSLCNLLVSMFTGMSMGSSVIVAQAFGAKDPKRLHRAVHTTYAVALASGLFLLTAGHFAAPFILRLMKTTPEIFNEAVTYARLTFYGALPLMVYNMGSGIMRSVGDSRRPFYYLAISTCMNFVLDLIFVAGFGLGAAGAGVATLLSQLVVAVLVTLNLCRFRGLFTLSLSHIRFYAAELRLILGIGVPAGIQNALISFSNVLIQAQVNRFGTDAIAGVSAANRMDAFLGVGAQAFSMTATTFTGQNIGAGYTHRLKRGAKTAILLSSGSSAIVGSLLLIFSHTLLGFFSPDPAVIHYGFLKMRALTPFHWIFAIAMVLSGILRGAGRSVVPMMISLITMCGLRMLWIYGVSPFWGSIDVIFLSYPISWFMNLVFALAYYKRKGLLTPSSPKTP